MAEWLVNESSDEPGSDADWKQEAPAAYTLSDSDGTKTVYAWARDSKLRLAESASLQVALDRVSPVVETFTLTSAATQSICFHTKRKILPDLWPL